METGRVLYKYSLHNLTLLTTLIVHYLPRLPIASFRPLWVEGILLAYKFGRYRAGLLYRPQIFQGVAAKNNHNRLKGAQASGPYSCRRTGTLGRSFGPLDRAKPCVAIIARFSSTVPYLYGNKWRKIVVRLSRRTVFVNFEGVRVVRSKKGINIIWFSGNYLHSDQVSWR